MGSRTGGCRTRSVKQALLMMGAIVASSVLLAGCADKPTYEADYDHFFTLGSLKHTVGMTTITTPEKISTAAATAVISGCVTRQIRN